MMDWMDVEISLDLISAARKHLHFLDNVDNIERLLTRNDLLEHAIRRYEQLWFPLVDECRSIHIVAPIDIEWMWYCHMLRPLAYRRDCRHILRRTLNHSFTRSSDIIESTNNSIEAWYEKYPKDGFNTIRNGQYIVPSKNNGKLTNSPSRLSVNLAEIAKYQIHFCYQVALPHFRDKQFLETALQRYKQFLCLKKLHPDVYLTPPTDILLMWFTHMCYPKEYAIDTMRACGRVLENNVKIHIGIITDKFRFASQDTIQKWEGVSKENLIQPGTKLRARDTMFEIKEMKIEDLKSCCVVVYKLSFNHAELTGMSKNMRQFRVRLSQEHCGLSTKDEVLILKGSKRQRIWNFKTTISYVTNLHSGLHVALTKDSNILCLKAEHIFASGRLKLTPILESMKQEERYLSLELEMDVPGQKSKFRLQLDGQIEERQPLTCNLMLLDETSGFRDRVLGGEQLQLTFGISTLTENRKNHRCFSQTVKLQNHENEQCFSCRVVHIPDLMLSGVQVFFYDKLMATSYVIGSSQLPLPVQVARSDLSMAFNPEIGERAMLIRNCNGDWGICIGRWAKVGVDEFLKIRFMRLSKVKLKTLDVDSVDMHFQSFYANLYHGTINIDPSNNAICENIALSFTISVLHVLCAPENPGRRMKLSFGAPHNLNSEEMKSNTIDTTVPESECALLQAAGLGTTTPNNTYLLKQHESLSVDLSTDAQDVYIEEVKIDRSLFKKESKLSKYDFKDSPRRTRQKKHSKHSDTSKTVLQDVANNTRDNKANTKTTVTEKAVKENKPKRIRKRRSTKLEDALCPSDDSLDLDIKEQMQFLQKNGKESAAIAESVAVKMIQKKKSSNLDEELSPSEDSLDEAEKEWNEFKNRDMVTTKVTQKEFENKTIAQNHELNVSNNENKVNFNETLNNAQLKEDQSKNISGLNQNVENSDKNETGGGETSITVTDKSEDKKETRKMRRKQLSRARALELSEDSQHIGTLTPVETDIIKKRKSKPRVAFDSGNETNTQSMQSINDSNGINESFDTETNNSKTKFY